MTRGEAARILKEKPYYTLESRLEAAQIVLTEGVPGQTPEDVQRYMAQALAFLCEAALKDLSSK